MKRIGYGELRAGDVLLSKEADFVLLAREGETFTWLDLSDKAFTADLNPTANVASNYTILRGEKVLRKGLE